MLSNHDIYIRSFSATAASTVSLPQYPYGGREVVVKDGSGGAATWNQICNTTDGTTIDGSASVPITTNYGYKKFRFNGTEWNSI